MSADDVMWADWEDTKEIIADVRDVDVGLRWVLFEYSAEDPKKLVVLEAGEGDLCDIAEHLDHSKVMYAFMQMVERVCGFLQWIPADAPMAMRSKASVHRALIASKLGSIAIDMTAHTLEDVSQSKFDEEIAYHQRTSGRQLDGSEAEVKLDQEKKRKLDNEAKQRLQGNTHEVQKTMARLEVSKRDVDPQANAILKAGSVSNIPKHTPAKSHSHQMYTKAKIDVEFEEPDVLTELLLDLREAAVGGDFEWMMLGYAEGKKNTIKLVDTGSGGREGLAAYIRDEVNGGVDKVLYLVIKEDDSTSKCTFLSWIGRNVGAFAKANASTHRGAISTWMTQVVHNLQEEYVGSCNDLLGLKEAPDEHSRQERLDGDTTVMSSSGDASGIDPNASVLELESKISSRPYTGKVIDTVSTKTPHQEWMDRKNAAGAPVDKNSPSKVDAAAGAEELTKVVLKSKGERAKPAGRSKFAQRKALDTTIGSAEAELLEREAAEKRRKAAELVEQSLHRASRSCTRSIVAKRAAVEEVVGEMPDWSPDESPYGSDGANEDADAALLDNNDSAAPDHEEEHPDSRQLASSADTTVAEASEAAALSKGGAGGEERGGGGAGKTAEERLVQEDSDAVQEVEEETEGEEEQRAAGVVRQAAATRAAAEVAAKAAGRGGEAAGSSETVKAGEVDAQVEAQVDAQEEEEAEAQGETEDEAAEEEERERAAAEREGEAAREREQAAEVARREAEEEVNVAAANQAKAAAEEKRKEEEEKAREAQVKAQAAAAEEEAEGKRKEEEAEGKRVLVEEERVAVEQREEEQREEQRRHEEKKAEGKRLEREEQAARAAAQEEEARERKAAEEREVEEEAERARGEAEATRVAADEDAAAAREAAQAVKKAHEEDARAETEATRKEAEEEEDARLAAQFAAPESKPAAPAGNPPPAQDAAQQEPAAQPQPAAAAPAPAAAPAAAPSPARPVGKVSDESEIRRRAEELLARKKALLEEAARKKRDAAANGERVVGTELNGALNGGVARSLPGDAERLKRAEEYRQKKLAELAAKHKSGGLAGGVAEGEAAKKAAFLKEAEEAVKRDAVKRASAEERRAKAVPTAHGSLTAVFGDESVESDGTPPGTPPSN